MTDPSSVDTLSRPAPATDPACRLCGARLHRILIDDIRICGTCTLVQHPNATGTPPEPTAPHPETFSKRLRLGPESLVIQIGSSSQLHPFRSAGIPVLPIHPATAFNTNTALQIAVRHGAADLVIANNVLQHVPDLFDFAAGLTSILRPNGMLTLQVPHLQALIQATQFDAFRDDTCNYLSLRVIEHVLRAAGLRVFDAERLPDDGGCLRVHACQTSGPHPSRPSLKAVRQSERFTELDHREFYTGFAERAAVLQSEIRDFLRTRRAANRRVAAYGAAPRGIKLLNACRITTNEITCIADTHPSPLNSPIPVVSLETLMADPPDDVLILPWPHATEIAQTLAPLKQRGTQFWIPLPRIARV